MIISWTISFLHWWLRSTTWFHISQCGCQQMWMPCWDSFWWCMPGIVFYDINSRWGSRCTWDCLFERTAIKLPFMITSGLNDLKCSSTCESYRLVQLGFRTFQVYFQGLRAKLWNMGARLERTRHPQAGRRMGRCRRPHRRSPRAPRRYYPTSPDAGPMLGRALLTPVDADTP